MEGAPFKMAVQVEQHLGARMRPTTLDLAGVRILYIHFIYFYIFAVLHVFLTSMCLSLGQKQHLTVPTPSWKNQIVGRSAYPPTRGATVRTPDPLYYNVSSKGKMTADFYYTLDKATKGELYAFVLNLFYWL